jgi:hypothetical protein
MAHFEFEIESDLPPERILAALTDFSDRRPDLWPGLRREDYQVLALGDTWAEIREGTGGPIWARERYDWSTPGRVTWTVQESGFSRSGDAVVVDVSPRPGAGSRIHVDWTRNGKNLVGRLVVATIVALRGGPVRRSIEAGLEKIARQPG